MTNILPDTRANLADLGLIAQVTIVVRYVLVFCIY